MTRHIKRFWSKVDKQGPYPKAYTKVKTRCWVWISAKENDNYGIFWDGKSNVRAHRFAYELRYGKASLRSKLACHKCDNPSCIRWSHLFSGTPKRNAHDRDRKGRTSLHIGLIDKKGEKNGNSKLTRKQVTKITKLYETGRYTQKEIGLMFGVTATPIYAIVNRRAWK